MPEFTETQKKMLAVLSDGKRHTYEEIHACCGPSSMNTIRVHINLLRKKLNPIGEDIICVARGYARYYQHVRLLTNPYDGMD